MVYNSLPVKSGDFIVWYVLFPCLKASGILSRHHRLIYTKSWSSMTWMGLTPHDFGHLQIFINHILLVISPYYMFIVRSPFSTAKSWKYPPSLGEFSHLVIFAQALYFDASSRSYAYRLWRSGCWPKNGCVGCHGFLQERRKNVWNIQSYPLVN